MLEAIGAGDRTAVDRLLSLLYDQLRALADRKLHGERAGHTLNATALVHEAYLRLVDQQVSWQNRAHFMAVAAIAMRRILINHAEARAAQKRGGGGPLATLSESLAGTSGHPDELIAIDRALTKLAELDARQARVVECRFFGGLSHEETAEALGVSEPTVRRDWRVAKAWLARELSISPDR